MSDAETAPIEAAQVRDAIASFVDAGGAVTSDIDDASRFMTLRSGEIFWLNDESITRLL
jgi:hypothetical protein